jgi:hypothetical protein
MTTIETTLLTCTGERQTSRESRPARFGLAGTAVALGLAFAATVALATSATALAATVAAVALSLAVVTAAILSVVIIVVKY